MGGKANYLSLISILKPMNTNQKDFLLNLKETVDYCWSLPKVAVVFFKISILSLSGFLWCFYFPIMGLPGKGVFLDKNLLWKNIPSNSLPKLVLFSFLVFSLHFFSARIFCKQILMRTLQDIWNFCCQMSYEEWQETFCASNFLSVALFLK